MIKYKKTFSVCISSVIEKEENFKAYRFITKSVIEKLGLEGIRNPEDVKIQYNFENELRENCDFFILIMGSAPSAMVERELKIALQRGIPIMVFVKVTYDRGGHIKFPGNVTTNLAKISPELYNAHITTFDDCDSLAKKLEEELQKCLFRKISLSPLIGLDPPVAYTEGVKLIREAKYRIVLAQKTSILLLGPRKGNQIEKEFYDELLDWLFTDRNQSTFFVHYFSLDETKKAMKSSEYALDEARYKLEQLYSKYGTSNAFSIRFTNHVEIVSHLIADTGLGINFWIGSSRYYLFLPCFMTKDSELNSIITSVQRVGRPFFKEDMDNLYNKASHGDSAKSGI